MPERMILFLTKVEAINAIAAVAMTIGLLVTCLLLDASLNELTALRTQMAMRNHQGGQALELLSRAVAELEIRNREASKTQKLLHEALKRPEP